MQCLYRALLKSKRGMHAPFPQVRLPVRGTRKSSLARGVYHVRLTPLHTGDLPGPGPITNRAPRSTRLSRHYHFSLRLRFEILNSHCSFTFHFDTKFEDSSHKSTVPFQCHFQIIIKVYIPDYRARLKSMTASLQSKLVIKMTQVDEFWL